MSLFGLEVDKGLGKDVKFSISASDNPGSVSPKVLLSLPAEGNWSDGKVPSTKLEVVHNPPEESK